jgi:hypothetical protein
MTIPVVGVFDKAVSTGSRIVGMKRKPHLPAGSGRASSTTDQETCLMAAIRLNDFLEFARERAIGGRDLDRGELAEAWRDSARLFQELQVSEAGAADKPQVLPLPARLQSHVNKLSSLDSFKGTFSAVPVAFGMVELNKLVAYQQYITQSSVDWMVANAHWPMTPADLAKLCLPLDPPDSGFRLARQDGDRYVFISDNHDGRFQGAQVIDPSQIVGLKVNGHAQSVLVLPFGYTTNVLNAVRFGNRIVLNNGYHRAVSLMSMGVTHAPCLIQVCSNWDDVELAGASAIWDGGEVFFNQARPPMLKDFFNPGLIRKFDTYRLRKEIRVTFEVDTLKLSI